MTTMLRIGALTLLLATVDSALGAPETGRICLAPVGELAREADHDMPGGRPQKREPFYEFTVAVDGGPRVEVPMSGRPKLLRDVLLNRRHLMVIRDRNEILESFWFTFESRGGGELCLQYGPWYQSWLLDPSREGDPSCRCGQ